MARASERSGPGVDRRGFLLGAAGAAAWLWAPRSGAAEAAAAAAALPEATLRLLESSKFAYISPLRSNGSESTCHGEVWFGWLDGTVVVNSRRGTWKNRALRDHGLELARVWVGDHGRWKAGSDEAFRKAPHFDAKARFEKDKALLDRLLALFEEKYEGEFDRWREDMRTGIYSGQRVLIRYEPICDPELGRC
jgi:hypothetical protein